MLHSDLALIVMIIVALIVVVPILKREIMRPSARHLDDLARNPEDRAVLAEVNRLLPSDPATAQRILNDHFAKEDVREEEGRAVLRAQAETNRSAAEQLRQMLREDLEVWEAIRKHSRKRGAVATGIPNALSNLDTWDKETRAELAHVDELLRKLKPE